MVAQGSVDLVREVHRRGAGGKLNNPAFWRVDKHLVSEDVLFHGLDELGGPGYFSLPVDQLPQPSHLFLEPLVARISFFIGPVGGHSVLSDLMQFKGLDLHFQGRPAVADHGCVQGLVHVLFGIANVVVELPGNGVPELVDHAQCLVTVRGFVDQNPQSEEVVDIAELLSLRLVLLHLEVCAVDAFGTADHLSGNVIFGQFVAERCGHFFDVVLAFRALRRKYLGDLPVLLFVQVPEGQVIQPPFDLPDTQAVGQGRVDV